MRSTICEIDADLLFRTIIEGMVPMSASDLAEEEERRLDSIREQLEEAEMREQEKMLAIKFNRGSGNNFRYVTNRISTFTTCRCNAQLTTLFRTNLEAMMPMTSEDLRAEERRWKSVRRQQLDDEEAAKQDMLVQTEFNRGPGNMMRYLFGNPQPGM